jgi:UDP-GlcNAc:undecaprenyl-phosphate GlcNAc-1-phosphate transferase
MTFAATILISALVALLATPLVIRLATRAGAIDMPGDERRIHEHPTPRWGGLAIYAAVLCGWLFVYPFSYHAPGTATIGPYSERSIWIMAIGLAVVLFGMLDDRFQLPAIWQALFLMVCGIVLAHPSLGGIRVEGITRPFSAPGSEGGFIGFSELNSVLFTAAFVFVVAKTMDTIDGIDGLASGIAAISAATMLILALNTQPLIGVLSAAAVGACLGFLRYNYNPAKIFLGTGGAQFLGFFLAAVSIGGVMKIAAAVAFLVPLTVFGVPIFDAFFVVARRIMGRVPITQADKRHIHHTLLGRGLSQRQTAWVLYISAIVLCGTAIIVVKLTS